MMFFLFVCLGHPQAFIAAVSISGGGAQASASEKFARDALSRAETLQGVATVSKKKL